LTNNNFLNGTLKHILDSKICHVTGNI
jgi:hypothetical protein